jgi:mannose-6-phosphate isomerase-like protein (cupin superfamily)
MFATNHRNDVLIEELATQRRDAMKAFEDITLIKNEKIAEYFYTKFQVGEDVPFSILENIPIGEALILPVIYGGAIITTKLEDKSSKTARYETRWTAGSTLTWHFHSDCTEEIIVTSGVIKVYVQGSVHVLNKNQKLTVAAGVGHQITALKDSVLDIKFHKIRV